MVRDNCPCVSAEVGMKFVQELEAAEMEKTEAAEMEKTKMLRSLEVGNNDEGELRQCRHHGWMFCP